MREQLRKYQNRIAGIVVLAVVALAVFTLHDMQFAEGVGLYFALKTGKDRLFFDVAVDIFGTAGLILLITLPCLFLKYRNLPALLRFLLAFLSFMPTLSMAYLLHPMQEEAEILLHHPLFILQAVLPVLCLFAVTVWVLPCGEAAELTESAPTAAGKKAWKRWYSVCCVVAALAFLVTLFVPSLQQLLDFVLTYLLLLICFDLWERLYLKYPALNTWGWILFGGLAFRAFYVLSEVMRRY